MESTKPISMSEHIARCATSGLSAADYAKREQIGLKKFYNARDRERAKARKLVIQSKSANRVGTQKVTTFKAVRVSEPAVFELPLRCVLVLPNGHRLEMNRLPEPQWLASFAGCVSVAR